MFALETVGTIGTEQVRTIMTYNEADPFTVSFAFATFDEDGDPMLNEWEFDRELLTHGLRDGAAGIGDVQVIAGSQHVSLRLTGKGNTVAILSFPRGDVENFLEQAFRLVPEGEESALIDVEAEWAEWRDADGAFG